MATKPSARSAESKGPGEKTRGLSKPETTNTHKLTPPPANDQEACERIVDVFEGEPEGEEWRCYCPLNGCHALFVGLKNNRLRVHCHKCGPDRQDELVAALKARHLWPQAPTIIMPVPDDAPSLNLTRWAKELGTPEHTWRYHDGQGRLLCAVVRFPGKQIRPFTFSSDGKWTMKGPNEPKPLFGLDVLAAMPDASVLICEGEKTAEAARRIFPSYAVISWMGGARGYRKADWSPIRGRHVVVFPDNDDPGLEASEGVAQCCAEAGAKLIAIVQLPDDLPEGWDLADDVPVGIALDPAALVEAAQPYEPQQIGTGLAALFTRYVWVTETKCFYDTALDTFLDEQQLNNEHAHLYKRPPLSKRLLASRDARKVRSMTYRPGAPQFVQENDREKLNLYKPNPIEPAAGDVKPLLDFLAYMFPDPQEQKTVLQWMAFQEQFPGEKINWALVVVGAVQGTGKTTLFVIMQAVLGEHNTRLVDGEELKGDFNGYLQRAILVCMEEVMMEGRFALANKFKNLVTGKSVTINEKFVKAYAQPNRVNFYLTSNYEHDAIAVEQHDRRFAVFRAPDKPKVPAYYGALYGWLAKRESIAALRHHLRGVDTRDFPAKAHAPDTQAKRDMTEANRHPTETYLASKFECGETPFGCDLVNPIHLLEALPRDVKKIKPYHLHSFLKRIGGEPLNQIRLDDGRKLRLWVLRNHSKWRKASPSDLAKAYRKPFRPGEAGSF